MLPSNFLTYIQKFFAGLVLGLVATFNDKATPQRYRFKTMLREELSVSGKWESVSVANTLVMADVVAMDSDLPLKSAMRSARPRAISSRSACACS